MRMKNRVVGVVAAVAVAAAAWGSIGRLREPLPAPEFTLTDLEGKTLSLKDYNGKVVLVMFWASWCGPCLTEIPALIELEKSYGKEGFAVLALSVNDARFTPEKAAEFVKQRKINYRVALKAEPVASMFGGIQSIPTAFLIDRKGNLHVRFVGAHPKSTFEKEILALLRPPPDPPKAKPASPPPAAKGS